MKSASVALVVASLLLSVAIGVVISRQGGGSGDVRAERAPLIGFSMDTLKEAR